jgi:hypothetical protein
LVTATTRPVGPDTAARTSPNSLRRQRKGSMCRDVSRQTQNCCNPSYLTLENSLVTNS